MKSDTSRPEPLRGEETGDDAVIGAALKWSLAAIICLAAAAAIAAFWWRRPEAIVARPAQAVAPPKVRQPPALELPRIAFHDATTEAGIDWRHENGAVGEKLLPETMGGGCAWLDYDNDGDPDLLLVNSTHWPWTQGAERMAPTCALYENQGDGRFRDATREAGLDLSLYGMGAAVGDYDNDGWVDIFISALGHDRLLRNEQGRFVDVTETAGVAGGADAWSTACGWFDYDNDGDLDLLVCHYLKWSREYDLAQDFRLTGGGRAYGRPQAFPGAQPSLWRNDGEAGFVDVAEAMGMHTSEPATGAPLAKSLGVVFFDFDNDGWTDVLIANDTVQNLLFRNLGGRAFQEQARVSGVAFDSAGRARGAMGVDVAHVREGGDIGVAIGNFANEMTALYVTRDNSMTFLDEAVAAGVGPVTRLELTFGVCLLDVDLDGRVDLFSANGHLEDEINRVQPSQHYEQPPRLLWNCGPDLDTEFTPLAAEQVGDDLLKPMVGRGAAYADYDGDGDLDLLITSVGGPPRLLRNDQALGNHWARVKLVGTTCNRDAIGARVALTAGGREWSATVSPTRSYLSQVELPLTFGLGGIDHIERLTITWPGGQKQVVERPEVDRLHIIEQATE